MRHWHDEGEQILGLLRQHGLEGEVFCAGSEREPVRYEDNALKMMESSTRTGFAVRLVEDGRVGFAAGTGPGLGHALVQRARAVARHGSEIDFRFPGPTAYPEVHTFDARIAELPARAMLDTGRHMIETIRKYQPDAQVGAGVSRSLGTVRLLNTSGLDLLHSGTGYGVGCGATLITDEGLLHTGESAGGYRLVEEIEPIIDSVLWQMEAAARSSTPADGRYPVIFAPTCLTDILRPLLACADGDAVDRGISPWRDRIGERLFDPRFSLIDDGLLPEGTSTTAWDDEGVPAQVTPILSGGTLQNFLTDLRTAARLGTPATGNGFRGGTGSMPGISPSNLVVSAGDMPVEDMVESVQDGLLVLSLMGAWGSNPYAGKVSGNVNLGYHVKGGEVVGRVKDCMIYIDVFEALGDALIALSREREQRYSNLFPHVLLDDVSVSTGR